MEGMNPNPHQQLYPITLITMYKWQSATQCDHLWAEPVVYKAFFKTEMQSNAFCYSLNPLGMGGGNTFYQQCGNSSGKDGNIWEEGKGAKDSSFISWPDMDLNTHLNEVSPGEMLHLGKRLCITDTALRELVGNYSLSLFRFTF